MYHKTKHGVILTATRTRIVQRNAITRSPHVSYDMTPSFPNKHTPTDASLTNTPTTTSVEFYLKRDHKGRENKKGLQKKYISQSVVSCSFCLMILSDLELSHSQNSASYSYVWSGFALPWWLLLLLAVTDGKMKENLQGVFQVSSLSFFFAAKNYTNRTNWCVISPL
jgi:hypothetical protein